MICHLYILISQKDGSFYIGVTNNLSDRIKQHNLGKSKYSRARLPWKLVFSKIFLSKSSAMREERKLKRMKSRNYIEKLIKFNNLK